MLGPVIEGKLVMLRPPRPDDAPVMIGWFEDMEVTRFMALHHPPSLEMEKEWLERMARSPDDVVWAIEHQGRPVGASAIHAINWKYGSGATGTTIGDRSLWGKGIGGETMQLRTSYAFTQLPMRKLKSGYTECKRSHSSRRTSVRIWLRHVPSTNTSLLQRPTSR